jgi:hypothetical protein
MRHPTPCGPPDTSQTSTRAFDYEVALLAWDATEPAASERGKRVEAFPVYRDNPCRCCSTSTEGPDAARTAHEDSVMLTTLAGRISLADFPVWKVGHGARCPG